MPMGLAFWIIMLLWLIFAIWRDWPNYPIVGFNATLFILLGLLGWKVFGAPLQ